MDHLQRTRFGCGSCDRRLKYWDSGSNIGWVLSAHDNDWKYNANSETGQRTDFEYSYYDSPLEDVNGVWYHIAVVVDKEYTPFVNGVSRVKPISAIKVMPAKPTMTRETDILSISATMAPEYITPNSLSISITMKSPYLKDRSRQMR